MMTAVEGMYGGLSALADTLQVRSFLESIISLSIFILLNRVDSFRTFA